MRELPDAIAMQWALNPAVAGKKIKDVYVVSSIILKGIKADEFKSSVIRKTVKSVVHCGANLTISLDEGYINFYLNSGWLSTVPDAGEARITFLLDDGTYIYYCDDFALGEVEYSEEPIRVKGKDPFSEECDFTYFYSQATLNSVMTKSFLTDQDIIAGLGEKCVNMILLRAKLSPICYVDQLSYSEVSTLFVSMRSVLRELLSSEASYMSIDEDTCPVCNHKFVDVLVHRRTKWKFCPYCQR